MSTTIGYVDFNGSINEVVSRIPRGLESEARTVREKLPTGFLYNESNIGVREWTQDDSRNTLHSVLGVLSEANSNSVEMLGHPDALFVYGYRIVLEEDPSKPYHMSINLGAAPVEGTAIKYAFLEVWKEAVDVDDENAVFFPYGNTNYKAGGTFNDCQLVIADKTGSGAPAYLANESGHGYYVKAKDPNIDKFISNPDNNISIDDDFRMYQIRYRVRVVTFDAQHYQVIMPHENRDVCIVQGFLAQPNPNIKFFASYIDSGLSIVKNTAVSLDYVMALPLCMVFRKNSTEFSVTNLNGGSLTASDVIDLRCHVSEGNTYDYRSMINRTFDKLLSGNLKTVAEPLSKNLTSTSYEDIDAFSTEPVVADALIGTGTSVPQDWEACVIGSLNGIKTEFSYKPTIEETTAKMVLGEEGATPSDSPISYDDKTHTVHINYGNDENHIVAFKEPLMMEQGSGSILGIWTGEDSDDGLALRREWTGLGTNHAQCVFDDKKYTSLQFVYTKEQREQVPLEVLIGHMFQDERTNLSFKLEGYKDTSVESGTIGKVLFTFSHDSDYIYEGNELPQLQLLKCNELGPNATLRNLTPIEQQWTIMDFGDINISGITVGDVYSFNKPGGISGTVYAKVAKIKGQKVVFRFSDYSSIRGIKIDNHLIRMSGSGSGPEIINLSGHTWKAYYSFYDYCIGKDAENPRIPFAPVSSFSSDTEVVCSAFLENKVNSSALTKSPVKGLMNTQFFEGEEQLLPNDGENYEPIVFRKHNKEVNVKAFINKNPCLGNYADIVVIKDEESYKMWAVHTHRDSIYFLESEDGDNWDESSKIRISLNSLSTISSLSVIKEGSMFKMWFKDDDVTSAGYFSTSSDGKLWTEPVALSGVGGKAFESMTVMKRQSDYMMFSTTGGYVGRHVSNDGLEWTNLEIGSLISDDGDMTGTVYRGSLRVIEDNGLYRCICARKGKLMEYISLDTKTWIQTSVLCDFLTKAKSCPVIMKDGPVYRLWGQIRSADLDLSYYSLVLSRTVGSENYNLAPSKESKIVMMYKSVAEQSDLNVKNARYNLNIFRSTWSFVTSLDVYSEDFDEFKYRDAVQHLVPDYPNVPGTECNGDRSGKSLSSLLEGRNIRGSYSTVTEYMAVRRINDIEVAFGLKEKEFIESHTEGRNYLGHKCHANVSSNTDVYNTTTSGSDMVLEALPQIIACDNKLYMLIGMVYGDTISDIFKQDAMIVRIPGIPLLKGRVIS